MKKVIHSSRLFLWNSKLEIIWRYQDWLLWADDWTNSLVVINFLFLIFDRCQLYNFSENLYSTHIFLWTTSVYIVLLWEIMMNILRMLDNLLFIFQKWCDWQMTINADQVWCLVAGIVDVIQLGIVRLQVGHQMDKLLHQRFQVSGLENQFL